MTDERDPKVSQRYRDLPGEEPSRALDQTILAAAHRSVDKPHAPLVVPAGRHRWYFSLGAAAILVLAVAVTLQLERQQPDAELAVPAPPAPQAAPAAKAEPRLQRSPTFAPNPGARQPAAPAPAPPPMTDAVAPRADEESAARRNEEARLAAEKARVQAEASPSELRKERAAGDVAASRAAPSPRASNSAVTAQYAAPTPERELERIAELRRDGRDEEADKALAEFRKRYPDYRIAEVMRQKVERKPAAAR